MRVLGFVLCATLAMSAAAEAAELTTVGDGAVKETAFAYEVHLDGLVARVTARQMLKGSVAGSEAVYSFALPASAAIVGLEVTPPGGDPAMAEAVDAAGAITAAADRDTVALAADLGLVRRLGALEVGGDVAYEARIYPVGSGVVTTVEIRWVQPLEYVDGRLQLRLPARGANDAFATATGKVTATPPAGVKELRDLHAGGTLLAAKPGKKAWTFEVGASDVALDVRPLLTQAVATFATAAVDGDTGAIALGILRPRATEAPDRFDQVVFVVDTSTSNATEASARDAMAVLVDAIADGLRDGVEMQAVLFDRAPRNAFGELTTVTAGKRTDLAAAIRKATVRSGSDLLAAFTSVDEVIATGEPGAATLVVIVTDGVLSTDTTADALSNMLGEHADVTVSTVLIAPDAAPLPDPRTGPLADLARRTGGHVAAVRVGEAEARVKTIADEVGAAADWDVLDVSAGDTELSVPLPDSLPAGGGAIAFGWYRGAAPKKLAFSSSGAKLTAKKSTIADVDALAVAGGHEALLPAGAVGTGTVDRALAKRSRSIGVVDARTALVAVDPADELARERLALAAKGGTFARIPPPPEEAIEVVPEAHVEDVVDVGARYIMDTQARIRVDLLSPQMLPAAKRCHRDALDEGGAKRGRASLEIEIARGEVMAVRATSSTLPSGLLECLRTAAYDLSVPTYTLTDGAETIHLIRYPIEFAASKLAIGDGDLEPIDTGIDVDDPLGDLESD